MEKSSSNELFNRLLVGEKLKLSNSIEMWILKFEFLNSLLLFDRMIFELFKLLSEETKETTEAKLM